MFPSVRTRLRKKDAGFKGGPRAIIEKRRDEHENRDRVKNSIAPDRP